jgi:hypothetical protein
MTLAPWQIVVHRQVAKPKQNRSYSQETFKFFFFFFLVRFM